MRVLPLLAALLGAPLACAATTEACYQDACAQITLPTCEAGREGLPLRVSGQLANPHHNSVTAWQLLADARWSYNANHQVVLSAGQPIASNGFLFASQFEQAVQLRGALPRNLLLAFGPRSGGHGFYDVAVEVALEPQDAQTVQLDLKPGSCPNPVNRDKRGLTPVAVIGSAALDVREIDLHSIRLAGVAPLRYSYSDVATALQPINGSYSCSTAQGDGRDDLTLKFATSELIDALEREAGRELFDGEVIRLNFSARLKQAGQCSGALVGSDSLQIIRNRP